MAEENPAPQGAPDEPTADAPTVPAQETDWKAEARKHEKYEKEWKAKAEANQAAADELAALREAQKTEQQRRDDEIAALKAENDAFKKRDQIKAWAEEITKDSPVPASALRGESREALEEHFQELVALIPEPAGDPTPQNKPVTTLGQQPAPQRSVPIVDQIAAAEKAGNTELVATLKAIQLGSISQS